MPIQPCPNCASLSQRYLEGMSARATVKYYRCDKCRHVWSIDLNKPAKVRHITPLTEPKKLR
jgi:hypothetical protein